MNIGQQTVKAEKSRRLHGRKTYSKKVRGLVITAISVLCVLSLVNISGGIYLWALFSRVSFDNGTNSDEYVDSLLPDDSGLGSGEAIDTYTIEQGASDVAQISVKGNTKYITNILLLGIDSRNSSYKGSRSDTTIILTINRQNKTIKLTSILRDTMVTIPGHDWNGDGYDDYAKFNAAFAYGGFDLMSKTIEQNFRLKIDQYIAVNFEAFSAAVQAMGGVNMELTGPEAKIVKVGTTDATYHLNGEQALTYARIRHLDSDFGRTNRQRKLITALINKAKGMGIGTLNSILMKVLPQVRTNMTSNELFGFTANALSYSSYTMKGTFHLPEDGKYHGKTYKSIGAVLILNDPAKSVTAMQEFIYS